MRLADQFRIVLPTLLFLFLGFGLPAPGFCQEFRDEASYELGLSAIGGQGRDCSTQTKYRALYPRLGFFLSERWELEFEGHVGHYRLDSQDLTAVGLNGLLIWEIWRCKYLGVYGLGGGGLLYLDLRERPLLGDSKILGLAQAGGGIRLYSQGPFCLRAEYRFQHISDPLDRHDHGLNYNCIVVGISYLIK
jgi:hypothetical protein